MEVISDGRNHWIDVDYVGYEMNMKHGAPNTRTVSYHCGGLVIREWVCVEHKGFAKHKADHWIKFRKGTPCNSVEELLWQSDILLTPVKILVQKKGKYSMIKDAKFNEENKNG